MSFGESYPNNISALLPQPSQHSPLDAHLTPPSPQPPPNLAETHQRRQVVNAPAGLPTPFPSPVVASRTGIANGPSDITQRAESEIANNQDPPQIPMPPEEYARYFQVQQQTQYMHGTGMSGIPSHAHFMSAPPGAISISHPSQAFGITTPPLTPASQGSPMSPASPPVFQSMAFNAIPTRPVMNPPSVSPPSSPAQIPGYISPPDALSGHSNFNILTQLQRAQITDFYGGPSSPVLSQAPGPFAKIPSPQMPSELASASMIPPRITLPPIPMIGPLKTHPTSLMTTINHFLSEPTAPQISPEIPFIDRLRSIAQQAHACETCGETYTPFSLAKLTAAQTLHCSCPNCASSICMTCLKSGCQNTCSTKPDTCPNLTHCEWSRTMLLYRILSSLDKFYLTEKRKAQTRNPSPPTSSQIGKGVGFTSGPSFLFPIPAAPIPKPSGQREMQLLSFFRGLAWILSTSTTEPGLLDLLKFSLLDVAIDEFLRNDSISDLSERMELSASFLACLESIGKNPRLAEFYNTPREEMASSDGLELIIAGQGQKRSMGEGSNSQIPKIVPLLELMDKLARQAETFCRTAENAHAHRQLNVGDVTVMDSMNLSRSILAVRQLLHMTSSQAGSTVQTTVASASSVQEVYRLRCFDLAYDEISTTSSSLYYYYGALANSITAVNPRRTITLAKELSTMATSLPPGIFVRNFPNRPDCIKALIAGPEDTPYFGGLFEFDIFATANYPAEPPKVHLLTTSQNRVRFGPNLYADGKVCLSLLGTWPGSADEQWQPYKSTIMQILISIQSMILCARPYFNEPGMGLARDIPDSVAYDKEVRLQAARVAICDWMVPDNKNRLWKDVIKFHFNHSATTIRQCLTAWAALDPRFRSYDVRSMKKCGSMKMSSIVPIPETSGAMVSAIAPSGGLGMTGGVGVFGGIDGLNSMGSVIGFPSIQSQGFPIITPQNAATPSPLENLLSRFEEGLREIMSW